MKRKKSDIWNHFSIISIGKAKCGYCDNILSYAGGASGNLSRHLRSKHPTLKAYSTSDDIIYDPLEFAIPEETYTSEAVPTHNNKDKKRSETWDHFSITTIGKAECSHCGNILSYAGGASGNLTRHLKSKHPIVTAQRATHSTSSNKKKKRFFTSAAVPIIENKKRSDVWNHFSITSIGKAKCAYCGKILSYAGGASGNLTRHITKKHPTVTYYISDNNEQTLSETSETVPIHIIENTGTYLSISNVDGSAMVTSLPENTRKAQKQISLTRSQELDTQLVKVIVKEYLSFKIVENPAFKKFVYMLCPNYSLPSRKTISTSLIPQFYDITKELVKNRLLNVDAVSLTIDGWTTNLKQSYITTTCHFIEEEEENIFLKSYLLGCIPCDQQHTADNLAALLIEQATEWGISNKIMCVTSDNTNNIVAAVENTNWLHFSCFAHSLNLVLEEGLKELDAQLVKIKSIVEYFKQSSAAVEKLQALQSQLNLPEVKLKHDAVTTWNSTYDMIERILKTKEAVIGVLEIENPALNTLTQSDWTVIEQSMSVFKLFYIITEDISADKTVTISKLTIFVKTITNHISKCQSEETATVINSLLTTLQNEMKARFENIESLELASHATFLDPRFKKYGFSSDDKFEEALNSIRQKVSPIYDEPSEPDLNEPTCSQSNDSEAPSLLWSAFDVKVKSVMSSPNQQAAAIIEVDKYLSEPLIHRNEDPLHWWNERKNIYPRLYTLMRRRLCVQATSVPSERIFSKAGLTISQLRSRLKPEKALMLLFLNHNLE